MAAHIANLLKASESLLNTATKTLLFAKCL